MVVPVAALVEAHAAVRQWEARVAVPAADRVVARRPSAVHAEAHAAVRLDTAEHMFNSRFWGVKRFRTNDR